MWKPGRAGGPGWEGPMGPGPPPAGGQGALPAAASKRRERGGGKGCLKSEEFLREKQRLQSANSEAEDAVLEDWGSWRAKGSRGREGSQGAGEGCGERGSGTPSRRGGEARWDDMQELRVWGRSCGHSPGAHAAPHAGPVPVPTARGGRRMTSVQWLCEGRPLDGWTRSGPKRQGWTDGRERDQCGLGAFLPGMSEGWMCLFV